MSLFYSAGLGGSAIPDRGDLHARHDATELSLSDGDPVSTFADETGNGNDLTAGTAPTFRTSQINGNPVVRFDGVGDFLDVAFGAISQPFQTFAVVRLNSFSTSSKSAIWSGEADTNGLFEQPDADNWRIFAGTAVDGGSPDTNPHIFNQFFDGANSKLAVDGANTLSGDAGAGDLNGYSLGTTANQVSFAEIDVGEILRYPQNKTGIESDVESYLSDKWGITI